MLTNTDNNQMAICGGWSIKEGKSGRQRKAGVLAYPEITGALPKQPTSGGIIATQQVSAIHSVQAESVTSTGQCGLATAPGTAADSRALDESADSASDCPCDAMRHNTINNRISI
jgi:hypothetical protein